MAHTKNQADYAAAIRLIINILTFPLVGEDDATIMRIEMDAESREFHLDARGVLADGGLITVASIDDMDLTQNGMRLAMQILADRLLKRPPSDAWVSRVALMSADLLFRHYNRPPQPTQAAAEQAEPTQEVPAL